jgi:hypothetical protein
MPSSVGRAFDRNKVGSRWITLVKKRPKGGPDSLLEVRAQGFEGRVSIHFARASPGACKRDEGPSFGLASVSDRQRRARAHDGLHHRRWRRLCNDEAEQLERRPEVREGKGDV